MGWVEMRRRTRPHEKRRCRGEGRLERVVAHAPSLTGERGGRATIAFMSTSTMTARARRARRCEEMRILGAQ